MAVRLHLKPGLVPAADRLASSPDAVVVREPTIGSTIRSKGSLYAIVTAVPSSGGHAADATRLVAETIERQYYYDESAGIPICLEKAVRSANQRLRHGRESHGLSRGAIGAAVAVVRGHELYVATIGDADAFLVRQARLLTLPDEERGEGLPNPDDAHVDVWRGDLLVGDTVLLAARNVTTTVGTEELKNAAVTLHPQSAAEHLHHLFVAGGGDRSDALMVLEAAELPATRSERKLVPVRPAEPLAGAPERSPIPLADPITEAAAAVQGRARRARKAASDAAAGFVDRVTDVLPRRQTRYRRVVALADRTESHRRVAIAFLAFLAVVVALGLSAWFLGGAIGGDVGKLSDAQRAVQTARDENDQVVQGNLITNDAEKAKRLLRDAWAQLDRAASLGAAASGLQSLRTQVQGGLDQLYRTTYTAASTLFSFAKLDPKADLAQLIRGPDGAAYVIDRTTASVVRIDLAARTAKVLFKKGDGAGKGIGAPAFLAPAGPDVLILDATQALWRWRPSDATGKGTLARLRLGGATALGADVLEIAGYVRSPSSGLSFFYVVDPSSKQILRYSPAGDGSGYPTDPTNFLAAPTDVSGIRGLYIDGDVYTLTKDGVQRYNSGQAATFSVDDPPDAADLRPNHDFRLMASTGARLQGRLWVWDASHERVIAYNKADGSYVGQYIVEPADAGYRDLRGMTIVERPGGQVPVLVWATAGQLMASPLEPAPEPGASPSPRPSGSSPTPAPSVTAKPR